MHGENVLPKKKYEKKVHFMKYQWILSNNNIQMQYYDKELMKVIDWVPDELGVTVTGPRKCIGFSQNGTYHPCIIQSYVDEFPQCLNCVSHSIPILRCIFEPECEGHKCPNSICSQPHQLYLAFFNTMPKIGMSSKNRLVLRVLEQGADAYSIISTKPTRYSARILEKKISRILQIKQSYESDELLKTMTRRIKFDGIEDKYNLMVKSLKNKFELDCSDLTFIDDYPLELPLRSMPKLQGIRGIYHGKVIGIKGKFLIYESNGFNALKMDDILGNYIFI